MRHREHICIKDDNGWSYLGHGEKAEAKIPEGVTVIRLYEKNKLFNSEASILKAAKQRHKSLNRINRSA